MVDNVITENIPFEIKALNQWVAWQGEWKSNGKMTKRPVNPLTGKYARTNDPSTWGSFGEAVSSCEKYGLHGVGFVFTGDDAYAGIDLDGCLDSETGVLSPEAHEILETFGSYTEVSPSGKGLHVFVKGWLPEGGRKNGKVEVYDRGRFFTVTGNRLPDTPAGIHNRAGALTEFYHKHFPGGPCEKPFTVIPRDTEEGRIPRGKSQEDFIRDDKEDYERHDAGLIERAMAARNGEDFRRLWDGDFSRYHSQSEADFALCRMLAFWTASDAERIDRLFRQSGLYRPKWDEPHFSNGSTYGQVTIERAIASAKIPPPSVPRKPQRFPLTDLGNAERLAHQFGDDIRYCRAMNSWLAWDGRRWLPDRTGEIQRRAKTVVRNIYDEAKAEEDDRRRRDIGKHAARSESGPRIKSMISLARDEEGISVLQEDFDADPWLLNCRNGTIDLNTGELLSHRRENLITRLVPVAYDPNAECPVWNDFLRRIMDGNSDVISFLQRAVGYSLTGDTSEQCLFFFWGTGANGKSTFLQTIKMMLNDYALQTPTETLLVKRRGAIPNDVARLSGARFVTATEAETDQRLAEGLIKQMTGGDTLSARFLNKEWFDFNPTHKIFLGTNHKPVIQGTDHAMWRRIRLVNFNVTIPEAERDKHLLRKLEGEWPGILAWAVRGCLEWRQNGLGEPEEVWAATNEYREEMDVLAQFLKDCCRLDGHAEVASKALWEAYVGWCNENSEEQVSRNQFGMKLKEKGFAPDRTGARPLRIYRGLELLTH